MVPKVRLDSLYLRTNRVAELPDRRIDHRTYLVGESRQRFDRELTSNVGADKGLERIVVVNGLRHGPNGDATRGSA